MAMTAHELARILLEGDDLPVHFQYNYGDYWNTQVAPEVEEVCDAAIEYSQYHQTDRVVNEDKEEFDEEKHTRVILLG
jgi:hypothetical protein